MEGNAMPAGGKLLSRAARGGAIATIVGAVILLVALGALAADPVLVEGNPTCPQGTTTFKIDGPDFGNGQKSDGTLTVTISNFDGQNASFDWSSNIGVDQVIVKGGPVANVYTYNPESKGDAGLHTPNNPNNDQNYGLSHVSFCYDVEQTPTPTPSESTSPSPTPTETVTPSTSPSPTTSVLPTETVRPGSPSPSTTVEGRHLGRTGWDILRWMLIGSVLVGLGVLAYVASKRTARNEN
jgi:hypothetical protein